MGKRITLNISGPRLTSRFVSLPHFYYGWIVVAVTSSTALLLFGIRPAPTVLIKPLEADFGWTRARISVAIAIGLICTGFSVAVSGVLMDQIGPRKVMVASLLMAGTSVIAASQLHRFWQLVLCWGFLSGLSTGSSAVFGASVGNRWFYQRRGLVQ
jgi:sugar phosphate permease